MTAPLFLAPLRIEEVALRRSVPRGDIERIGMGPARATSARARVARLSARERPLVLVGLGGGLEPGGRAGEVVVGSAIQCVGSDETVELEGTDRIVEVLLDAGLSAAAAPIISSPRIIHGTDARDEARSRGAAAVDMESFWCAPLAATHPFVVCRVLADVPGKDLWSRHTPLGAVRALAVIGRVARALRDAPAVTFEFRSVEEADL